MYIYFSKLIQENINMFLVTERYNVSYYFPKLKFKFGLECYHWHVFCRYDKAKWIYPLKTQIFYNLFFWSWILIVELLKIRILLYTFFYIKGLLKLSKTRHSPLLHEICFQIISSIPFDVVKAERQAINNLF